MTWKEDYLRRMADVIERNGHAVQYVTGDPDTGGRPFAYTVGLHKTPGRDYELALSGLPRTSPPRSSTTSPPRCRAAPASLPTEPRSTDSSTADSRCASGRYASRRSSS